MAGPIHTYGSTCLLSDDDPDPSTWYTLQTPPRARPQYFYTSSLPIDDPLTSLPPPSSGQTGNERAPPQPFSAKDNIALEESWKTLRDNAGKKVDAKVASREGSTRNSVISVPGPEAGRRRHTWGRDDGSLFGSQQNSPNISASPGGDRPLNTSRVRPGQRASSATPDDEVGDGSRSGTPGFRKRERSSFSYNTKAFRRKTSPFGEDAALGDTEGGSGRATPSRDVSISGSPFIRAPLPQSQSPFGRSIESGSWQEGEEDINPTAPKPSGLRTSVHPGGSLGDSQTEAAEEYPYDQNTKAKIPVGVSRLHLVELPNLKVYCCFLPALTYEVED